MLSAKLSRVTELLRLETLRANEAESRVLELTTRLKSINEARVTAVREAARANESLGLYKFQLETAQNEIHRAQSVFDLVEKERYRAEVAGAKTRTTARKLLERHKIHMAREEGRRMGLQEGLEAGRVGVYREVDAQSNFGDSQINDLDDDESESDHDDYAATEALDSPSPPRNDPPILPASPVRPSPAPEPPLSPIYVPLHDIHPILVHNAAPHPQHGHFNVPPEGYIPTTTATDPILHIPPAHEFVEPTPPIADASGAAGESGVAPSAFVTPHRSHHGSPSQSMRAESVRRAPSAVRLSISFALSLIISARPGLVVGSNACSTYVNKYIQYGASSATTLCRATIFLIIGFLWWRLCKRLIGPDCNKCTPSIPTPIVRLVTFREKWEPCKG
ncbi:hypothetical protein C8J57DRAFT_582985 [Mycena rebaudengoi]|nr:hypothetical protein C8J57DRAFT_582985 [Mycena rebaudengoi]